MTNQHVPTIQIALVNANLVGTFVQFLIRAPALKILPLGVARAKIHRILERIRVQIVVPEVMAMMVASDMLFLWARSAGCPSQSPALFLLR